MFRQSINRKWVATLLLALGIGAVWAAVIGLGGSIVGALMPRSLMTSETLVLAVDGTPLIQSRLDGNYNNTELRTLDGQTIELDEESWLSGVSFGKPYQEPGVLQLPISWRERIAGCSDYSKPPTSWLLIRDDRRPGSAYFTGYDTISKLNVGYIGRNGFRSTVPPADEQFDLGNHTFAWGSNAVASAVRIQYGSPAYQYGAKKAEDDRHLAPWIVFLLDGNVIQQIDLRSHTVRPLEKMDDIFALGVAWQPVPASGEADKEVEKQDNSDQQTSRVLSKFRLAAMQDKIYTFTYAAPYVPINTKTKTTHRLLARCTDRIVALNPFDGSLQEFPLPQELQQESLTAYSIADDQLLLQVGGGHWEHGSITNLLWLNSAGEVTREETLRLAGYTPGDPRKQSLGIAALVPSLLPWAIGTGIVSPLTLVQSHQSDNYVAGLSKSLSRFGPALLLILVVSIVLTLLVRHWQKKYCRDNTTLWCVTVFATTVPGLLAYWLMHRGTVMEPCPACSQPTPRKRDACAHCEKPFPAPPRLGTEILT